MAGTDLYLDCLHYALLPLEHYTKQIIGQAVLRSEGKLSEIHKDVQELLTDSRSATKENEQDISNTTTDKSIPEFIVDIESPSSPAWPNSY